MSMKFLKIYATTPESEPQNISLKKEAVDGIKYYDHIARTAKWSEDQGFTGTLIYSNNSLVDGWAVAQIILQQTKHLTPLVAVNPVYIRPYTLAKRVASLAFMYNRRVDINWIAGGFKGDLISLGDDTAHDERYEKLYDYASLVKGALQSKGLFNHDGPYFKVVNIKMRPQISEALIPVELISGTSEAGIATANKLGATKVKYAKPISEYNDIVASDSFDLGIRFGIIARETSEAAWKLANERFPDDMKGSMAHVMATKASDSNWHKEISSLDTTQHREVYWLKPFHTYKTFCPYLVGSHSEVAEMLSKYVKLGHTSIILDIMNEQLDFEHCQKVFNMVESLLETTLKEKMAPLSH